MSKIIDDALSLDRSLKQMLAVVQSSESQQLRLRKENYFRAINGFSKVSAPYSIVTTERFEAHSDFTQAVESSRRRFIEPQTFFNLGINEQCDLLDSRLFIFTNHFVQDGTGDVDILYRVKQLEELRRRLERSLFVCWDWDNHHALHVSTLMASLSDVYFYAHDANLYFLRQYCTRIYRLPCSSYQFRTDFILRSISKIVKKERKFDFKGVHVYYPLFVNRNIAVKTMSNRYPMVHFMDNSRNYHQMSDSDRLDDWLESYFIFIAPTLLDVPCRLFDTLLTGGIPFVPRSLASDEVLAGIHDDDIVFYDDLDLLSPENLLIEGRSKLDRWGDTGIVRRVFYAAFNHNFCSRFRAMMTKLELFLQKN